MSGFIRFKNGDRMDDVIKLFLLVISIHHVTAWTFRSFGSLNCACRWKYGGRCKLACETGEFIIGKSPCGFGRFGTCCAPNLSCVAHGGVCRRAGCDQATESVYRYKTSCSRRTTCCLRKARTTERLDLHRDILEPEPNITLPLECGSRGLTGRILGGPFVPSSCSWPWMVSIRSGRRQNPGAFICAGVLVSPTRVLTTARCVLRRRVFVTVGENDPDVFGEIWEQSINVRRVRVSRAGFGGRSIRKSRGCTQPVCLPRPGDVLTDNSKCFVAGWGRSRNSVTPLQQGLVDASVHIVKNDLCSLVIGMAANRQLPSDKFCSAPNMNGQSTCPGDEGGMLVCEDSRHGFVWSLFGIITENACSQSLPVIYTNIKSHLPWIKANL